MIDYALSFYNNYTIIFYVLLTVTVILEGPITILTLALLAPKFGFSFLLIYSFGFIGEFFGDLAHYFVGRFFEKNLLSNKKYKVFEKIEKKLENHSLFDQIIVIKYIPPITSIGLLYLGFNKTNLITFIKNIIVFAGLNSLIITFIGFNFGILIKDRQEFEYIIIGIMISLLILYLTLKIISSFIIKKYLNGNNKQNS
ncbi:MAG: hypothetical protein WC850_00055 [Candidatus Gracilibacteria bacterium]